LEDEGLPLVEGALGAHEREVPQGEVVVGEDGLHLEVVLLDLLEFLLQALGHALCHGFYLMN
jgi:hypothetical protein